MALKTLLLRSKLDALKGQLDKLSELDAGFEAREAELIEAVEEMTAETPEEDRQVVEAQAAELDAEKEIHESEKKRLQEEIAEIEAEIASEEARQEAVAPVKEQEIEERKAVYPTMENRTKFFGMSVQERDAFFMRSDIQKFLGDVRDLIANKRAINGKELLFPVVMLDLIRENIMDYSKLIRRVRLRQVSGTARQTVMGLIPEAVWTEMCGALNELDFDFTQVQVDGFKVGGYVAVCNALLQDNDIGLLSEIITGIGQAIGLALDKAILYGEGAAKKQPLGIVTRIGQPEIPSDYQDTARPWQDLTETHIIEVEGGSGQEFFMNLLMAESVCDGRYSRGRKFWAMNSKTYAYVKAMAVSTNMAGAFVSEVDGVMPVTGGDIVVLEFIPDSNIICGYGDLYLLVEREGTAIEQSREARFIEDQTVIRGKARYDGLPVIAEGFALITVMGGMPALTTFATDRANNAHLSDLQVPGAEIEFESDTYTYDVNISDDNVETVSVYPTPEEEGAEVIIKKGNKKYVAGAPIPVSNSAVNVVTVQVNKGAATLTYTLNIAFGEGGGGGQ